MPRSQRRRKFPRSTVPVCPEFLALLKKLKDVGEAATLCLNLCQKTLMDTEHPAEVRPLSLELERTSKEVEPCRAVSKGALNYRSPLKRALVTGLTRMPDASNQRLCDWLDEDGAADLPPALRKQGNDRSFAVAYRDPDSKQKLQSIFAKVRADLRKLRLLN